MQATYLLGGSIKIGARPFCVEACLFWWFQIFAYPAFKGIFNSKMQICWKCTDSQDIKDVHELFFSPEQVKFSITPLTHHQWILCSEWVPSEWESNDTYSLQMIHWWPSDAMLNLSKSVQMIKQTHPHLECLKSEYIFSKYNFLVELFLIFLFDS